MSERELIQIEANEDPNSVKDRLSFYRGKRVLLIWPEEGTALTRKLDLVLIQREAMRRQIKLAFVTHDPQVMRHANELDISTFETIGASERKRWQRGRTRVFTGRERRPSGSPTPEELEAVGSRSRGRRQRLSLMGILMRVAFIGVLMAFAFAVFYFLVPGATVTIVPAQQGIEASVQITVDQAVTDVDIENAVLPAIPLRVEIEETVQIATTGSQDLGSQVAVGEVVFINRSNDAIDIPQGTTISTSAGAPILFRTTQDATLPAGDGQEVTVSIEATQSSAGEIGNVGANLINTIIGPLDERADVINIQPTREGSSRTEAAVTSNDRDRLEIQINQLLQQRALDEIRALPQIGEDQFIIEDTLRIVEERPEWTRYSAQPGELAPTLTLTKRAIVQALVVDTSLGQQIVFANIARQIPRGRSLDPDSITYERGEVTFTGQLILFTMSGSGTINAVINPSQIKNDIANMTLNEAMTYLTEQVDILGTSQPEIIVSPNLFGRLPIWSERIEVEVIPAS
jgi:hypothetical protein